MRIGLITGLILIITSSYSLAQNEIDVVRYLGTNPEGTARFSSMAGAFSSLGGDPSTLITNPAGSAIYTKKELSITPGFTLNSANSEVYGFSEQASTSKLVFSNIAYISSSKGSENKSLYATFGMGYSKIADFNKKYSLDFDNDLSSMLFSFTDAAYGIEYYNLANETPFTSSLAYETYLIDPVEDTPTYYLTNPLYEEEFNGVGQRVDVEENGSMGDLHFNFGAGIEEKFFFGATMSIINGKYEQEHSFFEQTQDDSLLLNEFVFRYSQQSEMSGINLKLGIILKPEDWVRVGLAYHLPYRLSIRDEYQTYMRSSWKDGELYEYNSPDGFIEYDLRNPGRWVLGFALVSKKRGLISLDVEWMDYSKARFESNDFDFSPENNSIAQTLNKNLLVRVGGEIWVKNINFRLGYSFKQNPYLNTEEQALAHFHTFAGGIGLLTRNNIFVNLSANYRQDSFVDTPYGSSISPHIENTYSNLLFLFSVGTRF